MTDSVHGRAHHADADRIGHWELVATSHRGALTKNDCELVIARMRDAKVAGPTIGPPG